MVARALQVTVRFDGKAFGADFREWRKRRGMNLRKTARVIGTSQSLLSRVELGAIVPRGDVLVGMLTISSLDFNDYCTTERDQCAS